MLKVERYQASDRWQHKGYWEALPVSYPNARFKLLKNRLAKETTETHVAHRILLNNMYVLTTVKWGHDQKIFIQDNPQFIALITE